MYSIRLAKQIHEDDTVSLPSSPEDDKDLSSAVSQIAGKMAADPNIATQPTSGVMSGLDSTDQSAIKKIADNNSTGQITNVGQLIKSATDKLDKDNTDESRTKKGFNLKSSQRQSYEEEISQIAKKKKLTINV